MQGHIDKLTKNVEIDIEQKPVGAVQWDFICSIPEAKASFIKNYQLGPEAIFIFPTSYCEGNCEQCNISETSEIDINKICDFLRQEKAKRLKYVIIDGDSIHYSKIKELIDCITSLGLMYSINLITPPSQEFLEYISRTVCKVQFKMENIDLEDKYSQKVIQSLRKIQEFGIYSAIIFGLSKENCSDIPTMINFCKENQVKQFSFYRLPFCCHSQKAITLLSAQEYKEICKKLLILRKNEEKNIHITSNDAIWKGCGACSISAVIFSDGTVSPCAYIPENCGDISNFSEVWTGKLFTQIRNSSLQGKCGECKYSFLCKGCRAFPYIKKQNALLSDEGCWLKNV